MAEDAGGVETGAGRGGGGGEEMKKRKREEKRENKLGKKDLKALSGREDETGNGSGRGGKRGGGEVLDPETKALMKKYRRGQSVAFKSVADRKLRGELKEREKVFGEAVLSAAQAEKWLMPSEAGYLEAEGLEQTRNFKQEDIVQHVGAAIKQTAFDLRLPDLGPYSIAYSKNGRSLLLGGRKGHLALLDWRRSNIVTEFQVKETVRDVTFLHNELFFAAAQKKYVFIYDKRGIELHCLKSHTNVSRMQFLPHHFLLATVGKAGILDYIDTSTGRHVAQHRTKKGPCKELEINPRNGVAYLGHSNGTVALWGPNLSTPLASFLAHRGPVTALAVDNTGNYVVSGGTDGMVKVWDIRTYKFLHGYFCPTAAKTISISQKGLLCVGQRSGIEIWREAITRKETRAYIRHRIPHGAEVEESFFCPYEDVLGIGHADGFSSLVVPGAGEPNFDTFVANPFETSKQRQEAEIHALLEKLPPESIVLDPERLGTVEKVHEEHWHEINDLAATSNAIASGKAVKEKKKTKGRNSSGKRHSKKQSNIIDEKRHAMMEEQKEKERVAKEKKAELLDVVEDKGHIPLALERFVRKGH